MGLFSKDIKSMEDLYVHGLQDLYYAENQIVKSLPKMIDKTTDGELRRGFQTHLKETENQVKRLGENLALDLPRLDVLFAPDCTREKARSAWD